MKTKTFLTSMLAVAGLVIFLIAPLLTQVGHAGPPPDKDVLVVNTTAQPVPTAAQGTTTVAGTVSLASGAAVNVGNSATNPVPVRDADNPARQPVNIHLEGDLAPGHSQTSCPTTLFTVPAGKELVVEYVSLWAVSANVETPQISIDRPGVQTEYLFFLERKGTSQIGNPLYGASQQTRLYYSPGDNVAFCVTRDTSADDLGFRIRLSGYVVNVP